MMAFAVAYGTIPTLGWHRGWLFRCGMFALEVDLVIDSIDLLRS